MNSLMVVGLLGAGDVLLASFGYPGTLLLLVAPYLFVRNRPLPTLLFGGGFAALLLEVLLYRLPGTLMLGVGVAVLLLHLGWDYLNWKHPGTQVLALLVYLITIEFCRVLAIRVMEGSWIHPDFTVHTAAFTVGCLMVVYRSIRRYRAGGRMT